MKSRVIVNGMLLAALPITVAAATWPGLARAESALRQVIEEFDEVRRLDAIGGELAMASAIVRSEGHDASALERLKAAEAGLVEFLARQRGSVADEEHQADEARGATEALEDLRATVGPEWLQMPSRERLERIEGARADVEALFGEAESGVERAEAAAGRIRTESLALVVAASLAWAVACLATVSGRDRSMRARIRLLHRSMVDPERESTAEPDVDRLLAEVEQARERMTARMEERGRELLRRERMAAIGLLAADVAHEINNPLNAMLGLSELSLEATAHGPVDEPSRREMHESLTVIRREIVRCRGIVQRLMAMVRKPETAQWIDATRLLAETLEVARAARPDRAACMNLVGEDRSVRIHAPPEDLRQVLLTLIINAADAISADGRIEVDATLTGREAWLRVRDNGRGFTPEVQARFDVPFSTTRADEGGTGLGLSIAHAIARDMGAELRAESGGPGKGSLFTLVLPLREDER